MQLGQQFPGDRPFANGLWAQTGHRSSNTLKRNLPKPNILFNNLIRLDSDAPSRLWTPMHLVAGSRPAPPSPRLAATASYSPPLWRATSVKLQLQQSSSTIQMQACMHAGNQPSEHIHRRTAVDHTCVTPCLHIAAPRPLGTQLCVVYGHNRVQNLSKATVRASAEPNCWATPSTTQRFPAELFSQNSIAFGRALGSSCDLATLSACLSDIEVLACLWATSGVEQL